MQKLLTTTLCLAMLVACKNETTSQNIQNEENLLNKTNQQVIELKDNNLSIDNKIDIEFSRTIEINKNSDINELIEKQSQYNLRVNTINNFQLSDSSLKCFDITNPIANPILINSSKFLDDSSAEVHFDFSKSKVIENIVKCDIFIKDNVVKSFKKSFYKDVVINSELTFDELNPGLNAGENKIGALIISSTGIFYIKNADLKLVANDVFFSSGSLISTFKKDEIDKTLDNKDGLSGGNLTIDSKNIYGVLSARFLGKNGGRQMKVPSKKEDRPITFSNLFLNNHFDCKNVGQGQNGENGDDGFPGLNGGNSGNLKISYTDINNLTTKELNFIPGLGSNGGTGGRSGKGTKGQIINFSYDNGFDNSCTKNCKAHMIKGNCKGIDGIDGVDGKEGIKGKDGIKGQFVF